MLAKVQDFAGVGPYALEAKVAVLDIFRPEKVFIPHPGKAAFSRLLVMGRGGAN